MTSVPLHTAASASDVPVSITTRPTTRSSVRASGVACGTQHSSPPTSFDSSKQAMLMRSAALRSSAKVVAPAELRARLAHLGDGARAVPRLDVHRPDRVLQDDDLEAIPQRVEHGGPDAVVGGQAAHAQAADAALAEPARQSR